MYKSALVFWVVMFFAGTLLAQKPLALNPLDPPFGLPPYSGVNGAYFSDIPPLDTCVHAVPFTLRGYDLNTAVVTVTDPSVVSIANNMLYVHKRGTTTITMTSVHPKYFYHLYFTDTTYETEVIKATVYVGPPSAPGVKIYSNPHPVCNTYYVNATHIDSTTAYQWKLNGAVTGTADSIITLSSPLKANDVLICTATNLGVCANSSGADTLKVFISPGIEVTPSANPACAGSLVAFTAIATNVGTTPMYQWQVNGVGAGTDNVFITSALKDNDVVKCIVSNPGQCIVPLSSSPVIMKVNAPPAVKFNSDLTILFGSSAQLNPVITADVISYSWSPGRGLSNTTIANPLCFPATATTYTLTVTNANGCQAQATIKIDVPINIPNAFTPNGDGINDTWNIPQLAYYPDCVIDIFNRFGGMVFQSKGYTTAWNGTYLGKVLPTGTYYYIVNNQNTKLTGSVTIIR
jgi:gliding motility-associated-like protein